VDLNRQWISPQKTTHPTIFHFKQVNSSKIQFLFESCKKLMKKTHEEKTVTFFCDFHGHSRKKNIFMCKTLNFQKKHVLNIILKMAAMEKTRLDEN